MASRTVPVVEVRGLALGLGAPALDFRVERGGRLAIVGRSGSGKTTLLLTLLGLRQSSSGASLRLLGEDVPGPGYPAVLRRVGVVFQEAPLFDHLSIAQNVALGTPSGDGELATRVRSLLDEVGLAAVPGDASPGVLSTGQRRRVALARALGGRPELLILDEPTAGLDEETARGVIDVILRVAADPGVSVVVVTHDQCLVAELGGSVQDLGGAPSSVPATRVSDAPERIAMEEAVLAKARRELSPLRQLGRRLGSVAGVSALLVAACTFAVGFVMVGSARQTGLIDPSRFVPRPATAVLAREVVPLLTGLLLAGRLGSSLAAEVASCRARWQDHDLRMLGTSVTRHFLLPASTAWVVGFPVVALVGLASALFGGWLAVELPGSGYSISGSFFLNQAWTALVRDHQLLGLLLLKTSLFGGLVAATVHLVAARGPRIAGRLGSRVTLAVTAASAAVVVVDALVELCAR